MITEQEVQDAQQPVTSDETWTSPTSQTTFLVSLTALVTVDVQVDARNEVEARNKAACWNSHFADGWNTIGTFWDDEGEEHEDDGEMYWQIQDETLHNVVEIVILGDADVQDEIVDTV